MFIDSLIVLEDNRTFWELNVFLYFQVHLIFPHDVNNYLFICLAYVWIILRIH